MGQKEPVMDLDALQRYLTEVSSRPFKMGQHDCLTFTNEAYRRMTGSGWSEDWLGKYMRNSDVPFTTRMLRQIYGFLTMVEGIDSKMDRVNGVPPRGALVAMRSPRDAVFPHALGIANGTIGAFLSADGMVYCPITDIEHGWVLRCRR